MTKTTTQEAHEIKLSKSQLTYWISAGMRPTAGVIMSSIYV